MDDIDSDKTRLRVKLGAAEIEYEGGAATLEKLVMPTVAKMIDMVESHSDLQRPHTPLQIEAGDPPIIGEPKHNGAQQHSTNTIAVAIKAKSGSDLALAASARLGLVEKKDRFSRKEILEEMKTAPAFFNKNMIGNLSKILATLTGSNKLRLVAEGTFALASEEKAKLELILAQIN